MNVSPAWCSVLREHGHVALHWRAVGDPAALDSEILSWAKANGYVVFTHDLDFAALLAASDADSPSVVQIRDLDILPDRAPERLLTALDACSAYLEEGALLVIDRLRARIRLLPLHRSNRRAEDRGRSLPEGPP